jgi:hypothetical protein
MNKRQPVATTTKAPITTDNAIGGKMSNNSSTNTDMKENLVQAIERIYSAIPQQPDSSLTKLQIKEVLGETLDSFYTNVVQVLVNTGHFIRVRNYSGGVKLNPVLDQSNLPDWLNVKHGIEQSFRDIEFETPTEATKSEDGEKRDKQERMLYKPLRDYLVRTGLFEVVDIAAKLQGAKWQNADLLGINYLSDSKYHANIEMRTTAFAVTNTFPSIQSIQQTSSHLTFANAAYLCYVDDQFRGSGMDEVVMRLRDEGLWDQIEQEGIGVIVIYYPQEKSQDPRFQTVRHIPFTPQSQGQIEQGIDLWATDETKARLCGVVAKQLAKTSAGVN